MTDSRREVLQLLGEASSLYPEMRLGQLLTWFASAALGPKVESIYDAEDDELIAAIQKHLSSTMARQRETAAS
jgi:hypothetical protein